MIVARPFVGSTFVASCPACSWRLEGWLPAAITFARDHESGFGHEARVGEVQQPDGTLAVLPRDVWTDQPVPAGAAPLHDSDGVTPRSVISQALVGAAPYQQAQRVLDNLARHGFAVVAAESIAAERAR